MQSLVTDRHGSLDVLLDRSCELVNRAAADSVSSPAPESNDRALYQTFNPLYTPAIASSNASANVPQGCGGSKESDKPPEVEQEEVLPAAAHSADERDDDNSANASMDRGDGAEADEPEWANLPEHEKVKLRKDRTFRYQLLKTRVKISQENHVHRPSIHGNFESFERVLDAMKAEARSQRKH